MSAASQKQPEIKQPQPIIPHLAVDGANAAIEFYERAFGVKTERFAESPEGRLLHGTLEFPNGGIVYLMDTREPGEVGRSPVTIHLDVSDVDAVYKRAVEAGATVVMPLEEQFWGDRYGCVADPFGHTWSMSTTVREVSPQELQNAIRKR